MRFLTRRARESISVGRGVFLVMGITACLGLNPSQADRPATAQARLGNQASRRSAGSAAQLTGHVVLYEIFLSDDLSSWPASLRSEIRRRTDEAVEFLRQQARLHDRQFTWERVAGRDVRHDGRLPVDPHADPAWSESVLRMAAGRNGATLVRELQTQYDADQVAVCLHVNRPGISYNLGFYERVRPEYSTERMICFTEYPDGRATAAATYAHELLHLFGAGDLYFPYDSTPDRERLARRSFPRDIMLRVDYDIQTLTVGPFTAFRVGWRDRLEPRWRYLED